MTQRILYLFCKLWLMAMVGAVTFVYGAELPSINLLSTKEYKQTIRQLQILRDPSRALSVGEMVERFRNEQPPIVNTLNLGFTSDAVWVVFQLKREEANGPHHWWFEIEQPLFMNVELYEQQEGGGFVKKSGRLDVALRQPVFDYRIPAFDLQLNDHNPKTYLLRVVTQSSMSASMVVWQPEQFVKHHVNSWFVWGCIYGAFLMIALFYGMWWIGSRERIHLVYALYVIVNLLASFFSDGWPRQFLPEMNEATYLTWVGIFISMAAPTATVFTFEFLHFKSGYLKWFPRAITAVSVAMFLLSVSLILSGNYSIAMPIIQFYILNFILLSLCVAAWRALRGDRSAQFFLMAFGIFYVGVAWRFLKNIGFLEPNFWSNNSYQIGAFGHMLVMSVSLLATYSRLGREKQHIEFRLQAESQRRQEQATFLGMVSHEFRTPLSIISTSSENMMADPGLSKPSRMRIEKISRANKRLSALIDEYLSYERLVTDSITTEHKVVDLGQVARRVTQESADSEGPTVQLQLDQPVMVIGDSELLRVALHNLVTNARRHSPAQKDVTIRVRRRDDHAEVIVQDQGPGVADEEREKIFDKFFRGKTAMGRPGAGIGLYLVKSIVQQHGGEVAQRNLHPSGCQFVIRLPAC